MQAEKHPAISTVETSSSNATPEVVLAGSRMWEMSVSRELKPENEQKT
jgi:hypothetical protein